MLQFPPFQICERPCRPAAGLCVHLAFCKYSVLLTLHVQSCLPTASHLGPGRRPHSKSQPAGMRRMHACEFDPTPNILAAIHAAAPYQGPAGLVHRRPHSASPRRGRRAEMAAPTDPPLGQVPARPSVAFIALPIEAPPRRSRPCRRQRRPTTRTHRRRRYSPPRSLLPARTAAAAGA